MEDDNDEFGDLYTDVLKPSTAASSSQQPPPTQSPAMRSINRPIDINTEGDDEDIRYGAPNSSFNFNSFVAFQQNQKTLIFQPGLSEERTEPVSIVAKNFDSNRNLNNGEQKARLAGIGNYWDKLDPKTRFLESGDDAKVQERAFGDPNFMDDIHDVVEESDDKDDLFVEQDDNLVGRDENIENLMGRSDDFENLVNRSENFDVEEVDTGIGEMGSRPMIPSLSTPGVSSVMDNQGDMKFEDDSDSDSEDDLQIVLNDNNHGHMGMVRIGGVGGGDDDEDENKEPLLIVADNDNPKHQSIEEQDWGEDVAQGADAERKELGEVVKVNGVDVAPKIGYSNHGYHPFHSQFKYVRPGAVPMPGAVPVGSGGAPGQVRPSTNMGPIAGRGRGDWRSTGMKTAPSIQKGFQPGYGMPVWGNNASGRGFGSGLEFTLPSYKTIFEVDIDSFEAKPWRLMGIDISDYFNFGLNEDIWKDYCKQLEQLRLEATMQSKIRVYESGRTVQEYDPDMPPELAAAAGIHDVPSENANVGKSDAGQNDLTKGYARARPSLPTGRAIQVESGYGERLPSIDTRPPRIRDSDAIIEIVLQDSADYDFYSGNDIFDKPSNDVSRGGGEMEEDIAQENTEHFDDLPHAYDGRKRELVGRGAPFVNPVPDNRAEGDRNMSFPSGAPAQYYPDSKGNYPVNPGRNFGISHEERKTKGARDRSRNMTSRGSMPDKQFLDNQNDSVESIDGQDSPISSSPVTVGTTRCLVVEDKDTTRDELVLADESSEREREEMALDTTTTNGTFKDEKLMHFVKKQKLSSQVEQPSLQEVDDAEDSKAGSSDNSKVRSGSSKDYWKSRDSVEEEVVQDGRSTRMGCTKRPVAGDEDNFRRRGRDERQETERHRISVKGRENPCPHKNWDPKLARHSHVKAVIVDKRKESDNSDGAWQWKDENLHGRRSTAEDSRKRERSDEMESKDRSKVHENERSDKDEHHQLKQLDNGSWRVPHDKDMGSRQRDKGVSLKSRNETVEDLRNKRRREEVQLRRDHGEKEEYLHVLRDNSSRQKRERDDILDQRKRVEQARLRDEDQHYAKHKEEGYFQRERGGRQREQDEWHRLKQSHEESLSKRKREEGRGGVRSGRAAEDKSWVSHSRVKDEYKGSDREYHLKETGRHGEQLKRRDRVENESISQHRGHADAYARGSQLSNDEKQAKHRRVSTRTDRVDNASDNQRVYEKKHKKNTKKGKESEGGDHNSSALFKKNQEKHNGRISETVSLKGTTEQGSDEHDISVNHQSSRKHREEASPDDDQQDSGRGRSKLERWISHKERDFSISMKASSLKVKEMDIYNKSESSLASKLVDESSKKVETVGNPHPLANEKDADDSGAKNVDVKPVEDRHLDTVAKLKQRSERFKLPMPIEKEAMTIKIMESEPLPSAQNETQADLEIKPERPTRKRRWTSK